MTWAEQTLDAIPTSTTCWLGSPAESERFTARAEQQAYLVAEPAAPGPALRGQLGLAVEDAIEAALSLRGAAPPGFAASTTLDASLSDQLYRARLIERRGIALIVPPLQGLVNAHGALDAEDSAALRWWLEQGHERPLMIGIHAENMLLAVYGPPTPLRDWLLLSVGKTSLAPGELSPPSSGSLASSVAAMAQRHDQSRTARAMAEVLTTPAESQLELTLEQQGETQSNEQAYHRWVSAALPQGVLRPMQLPEGSTEAINRPADEGQANEDKTAPGEAKHPPSKDADAPEAATSELAATDASGTEAAVSEVADDVGATEAVDSEPAADDEPVADDANATEAAVSETGAPELAAAQAAASDSPTSEARGQPTDHETPASQPHGPTLTRVEDASMQDDDGSTRESGVQLAPLVRPNEPDDSQAPTSEASEDAQPQDDPPASGCSSAGSAPADETQHNSLSAVARAEALDDADFTELPPDEEAPEAAPRQAEASAPLSAPAKADESPAVPSQPAKPATQSLHPRAAEQWRGWMRELDNARGPKPLSFVEQMFVSNYVPLRDAVSRGLAEPKAEQVLDDWSNSFAESYSEAFDALKLRGKRPTMVLDVPELALRIARLHGARSVQLILVDGMRFDLGLMIQERMKHQVGRRGALTERLLLWSALPSTTSVQLDLLGRGSEALKDFRAEEVASESMVARGRAATILRRIKTSHRELLKLDVIEARLGGRGGPIAERLDLLADEASQVLSDYLSQLPPRTLAVVFGDHGFLLEGLDGGTSAAQSGGATPEEVLVPAFAWLMGSIH